MLRTSMDLWEAERRYRAGLGGGDALPPDLDLDLDLSADSELPVRASRESRILAVRDLKLKLCSRRYRIWLNGAQTQKGGGGGGGQKNR